MSDEQEWEDAGSMEATGHAGPWPAFVDLFAATTLVLLVFFVVIAYRYIGDVGDAVRVNDLIAQLEQMEKGGQFDVQKQGPDVLLILEERVTFGTSRSELLDPARGTLRDVIGVLREDRFKGLIREIEILGHADRRGDPVENWRLSANRAVSVADFLIRDVRENPCTIIASGRGAYFPRDSSLNVDALPPAARAAAYSRDRRVEILLHPAVTRDRALGRSGCLRGLRATSPVPPAPVAPPVRPRISPDTSAAAAASVTTPRDSA